jgi:hypothetical protein
MSLVAVDTSCGNAMLTCHAAVADALPAVSWSEGAMTSEPVRQLET